MPSRAWSVAAVLAIAGAVVAADVAAPQASGHSVLPVLRDRNLMLQLEALKRN